MNDLSKGLPRCSKCDSPVEPIRSTKGDYFELLFECCSSIQVIRFRGSFLRYATPTEIIAKIPKTLFDE